MELIYTPKGIFCYFDGYPRYRVRRIRVASIVIPQLPKIHLQETLDQIQLKHGRDAIYSDSDYKQVMFMRNRDHGLMTKSDSPLILKFKLQKFRETLASFLETGIDIQFQKLDNGILVVGFEYQPDLVFTPMDEVSIEFEPSILDSYADLQYLEDIIIFSKNLNPLLKPLRQHPQGQAINESFLSVVMHEAIVASNNKFHIPEIFIESENPLFYINGASFNILPGIHLFTIGKDLSFLHFIQNLSGRRILFGKSCPLGYTEIPLSLLRVDLNDLLSYDEGHVLLQIYEYLFDEDGFSTAFTVVNREFRKSVHEYSSRYEAFSSLLAGLEEAIQTGWMINAIDLIQTAMNGLASLSTKLSFDPTENDLLSDLPQRVFIPMTPDLPSMAFFILCLILRCDIDGIPVDYFILDHEPLSKLLFREKMQTLMTRNDFPFFSYPFIHRVYYNKILFHSHPTLTLDATGSKIVDESDQSSIFLSSLLIYNQVKIPVTLPVANYRRIEELMMENEFEIQIQNAIEYETTVESTPSQITNVVDQLPKAEIEVTIENGPASISENIDVLPSINDSCDTEEDSTILSPSKIQNANPIIDQIEIDTNVQIQLDDIYTESSELAPHDINDPISDIETDTTHKSAYERIFDTSTQLEKIRNSDIVIDPLHMLKQIEELIEVNKLLITLREHPISYIQSSTSDFVTRKGFAEVVVSPDGSTLNITSEGMDKLGERMNELAASSSRFDRYHLEEILVHHGEIIEAARLRGNLAYFVSLYNWAQLLSICYYNRYSKYDPITASYCQVIKFILDKNGFFDFKRLDEILSIIIDHYLAHFHELEQEIRLPYVTQEEHSTPVPKPNDIPVVEIEDKNQNTKKELKALYKSLKQTKAKLRENSEVRVIKKKESLVKHRRFRNVVIPRGRTNTFDINEFYELSVQHLKVPRNLRTFLAIVDKDMTIGEFKDSDIDWTQLDLSKQTINAIMDIRDIIRSGISKDDLFYLLDDNSVQMLIEKGLRSGYYSDEILIQTPKKHFTRYLGIGSPKQIIAPLLKYLLPEGKGSTDTQLQELKSSARIITNEGPKPIDLSYTLKFQELYDISTDKNMVIQEFKQKLMLDLDKVVLPQKWLRKTRDDNNVVVL